LVVEKQQLEDRLRGVQGELSDVQHQLQVERRQVELKMEQIRRLEDDIQKGHGHEDSQRLNLESALKLANERISEMQSNDERASKQVRELLDVVETLKTRISDLEAQIERHREEEIAASVECQKLKSEISNLKADNEKSLYRIKGLNDQITSLTRELNENAKQEASLKLEIKKLEEEKQCLIVAAPRSNGFPSAFENSDQHSVTKLENELQMVTKRAVRLKKELDDVYEQKTHVESELQSKTKELSVIGESLYLNQTEVGKLREEKNRLEADLNTLLISKRTYEQRVNDLGDKLKMEQNMVRAFKSELSTREDDYARRQNIQQELESLRNQVTHLSNVLDSEQTARRIAEQNVHELDAESRALKSTYNQTVEHHKSQMQGKNATIDQLNIREKELIEENYLLQRDIDALKQELQQKIEASQKQDVRRQTGASANSNSEYESLTKEQLIQRLQREITIKDQAISKLVMIGSAKGIKDESVLPSKPSKKNKDNEKRIKELAEIKMKEERGRYEKRIAELEGNFNFMQKTLYDEQQKREEYEAELYDLRMFADEMKNRNHSDVDTQSLDSRSNTEAFPPHPALICNGILSVRQSSAIYGNKRKKLSWETLQLHLTEKFLSFYKPGNVKGQPPLLTIAVEMLYLVRKVSEADLRSVNKKQLPLILQIFYESGISGNKNSSRRGSTIDLNVSAFSNSGDSVRNISTSNSALNYTGDDVSLSGTGGNTSMMNMTFGGGGGSGRGKKQQHDFIEVSYHTSTSCDFCKRSMSSIFRNIVAFECKRCHQKYHKEHVEKNEVPPCKCSFESASELFIMAEREDQAKVWYTTLTKLINMRSTVKRANSNVNSRQAGSSTPTRGFHFGA
jgi:Rho-associated protein kinase 1